MSTTKKTLIALAIALVVAWPLFLGSRLARPVESKREVLRGRSIDSNGIEHWLTPDEMPKPLTPEEFERVKNELRKWKESQK